MSDMEAKLRAGLRGKLFALVYDDHGPATVNLMRSRSKPAPVPQATVSRHVRIVDGYRAEPPSLQDIAEAVCSASHVSEVDFQSHRRNKSYAVARQIYYWLAKKLTIKTLPQIAKHAGDRDHTTVIHGIKKIERTRHEHAAVIAAVLADLRINPAKVEGQG